MTDEIEEQVSEAEIAVHWREEEYHRPPAKFIGQARPEDFLGWDADAGDYEITALDDHGRASSCSVIVH